MYTESWTDEKKVFYEKMIILIILIKYYFNYILL